MTQKSSVSLISIVNLLISETKRDCVLMYERFLEESKEKSKLESFEVYFNNTIDAPMDIGNIANMDLDNQLIMNTEGKNCK